MSDGESPIAVDPDAEATESAPDAEPAPALVAAPENAPPADSARPPVDRVALGPVPPPIEPVDSFATAGRKAMWLHVDRMLARESTIRDPSEVDALRKYRVATRRLRAAIRVFRDAYPGRELKSIRAGLAELAEAIGTVRDLDVRIADLDRWAAGSEGPDVELEPLREAWARERTQAANALYRRLDAKRHRRLMASLATFVTTPDEAPTPAASGGPVRTVRDRAASSTWEAFERLRSYTQVVRWADLETLHAMRIEAKRLRYTIEFLGPVLGPEREWLIARLVAVQDHLGALNDAAVTGAAVRAFLEARHAGLQPAQRSAIAAYLGERERDLARLRRSVGRAWRPATSITFAHRLGRVVVVRPAG